MRTRRGDKGQTTAKHLARLQFHEALHGQVASLDELLDLRLGSGGLLAVSILLVPGLLQDNLLSYGLRLAEPEKLLKDDLLLLASGQ